MCDIIIRGETEKLLGELLSQREQEKEKEKETKSFKDRKYSRHNAMPYYDFPI